MYVHVTLKKRGEAGQQEGSGNRLLAANTEFDLWDLCNKSREARSSGCPMSFTCVLWPCLHMHRSEEVNVLWLALFLFSVFTWSVCLGSLSSGCLLCKVFVWMNGEGAEWKGRKLCKAGDRIMLPMFSSGHQSRPGLDAWHRAPTGHFLSNVYAFYLAPQLYSLSL